MKQAPLWLGGNATVDPYFSFDNPKTKPLANPISFYTGESDITLTHGYGLWTGLPTYMTTKEVYNADYTDVETVWYNPWTANVPIMGTNGFQF